jgi:uncharacterized membrane protein YadS
MGWGFDHEIAQVVAAAFQNGTDAGNFGTIVKLSSVMLLAPMILALGYFSAKDQSSEGGAGELSTRQGVPKPWFVAGLSQ